MSFIVKVLVNGVALWVASLLIDGINFGGSNTTARVLTIGGVALVFGVLNAILRPVLMVFSIPLLVLTLGLFTFIVNAIMLSITSWLSGKLGLDFTVTHFFWAAVLGALIITIVSTILSTLLPETGR